MEEGCDQSGDKGRHGRRGGERSHPRPTQRGARQAGLLTRGRAASTTSPTGGIDESGKQGSQPAPAHLRGKAFATHSVAVEDGQAKAAGAEGFSTAGEHKQARRLANLPPPGAGVSCNCSFAVDFGRCGGLTVSLSLQVLQCQKSAHCPRQDLSVITGRHLGACSVRLSVANPALAAEWHPTKNGELTPSDVAAGCNEKAWWAGSCGHEWQATIDSRDR